MVLACTSSRTRGFTLLEVMFATTIGVFFLSILVAMVRSSSRVSTIDRAHAQMLSDHRRSVEFLTNTLRGIDIDTLDGVKIGLGTLGEPQFQRPIGTQDGQRQLGGLEQLVWRPSPQPVSGVVHPGAVWLTGPTGDTLAADCVPKGGLLLMPDGRCIAIRLTTYHPMPGETAIRVSSTTTVSVRN